MKPMKFRKKPIVVEAMQLRHDNVLDVLEWCGGIEYRTYIRAGRSKEKAWSGDWIVRHEDGSFLVVGRHEFSNEYEPALPRHGAGIEGEGMSQKPLIDMLRDLWQKLDGEDEQTVNDAIVEIADQQQRIKNLTEACEILLDVLPGHSEHWDHTMSHGVGCEACKRQREVREKVCLLMQEEPS